MKMEKDSREEEGEEVQLFLPFGRMEIGINRLLWKARGRDEIEALGEILREWREETSGEPVGDPEGPPGEGGGSREGDSI